MEVRLHSRRNVCANAVHSRITNTKLYKLMEVRLHSRHDVCADAVHLRITHTQKLETDGGAPTFTPQFICACHCKYLQDVGLMTWSGALPFTFHFTFFVCASAYLERMCSREYDQVHFYSLSSSHFFACQRIYLKSMGQMICYTNKNNSRTWWRHATIHGAPLWLNLHYLYPVCASA